MRSDRILYTVTEFIFNAIALLLALRILLRFFGANPATPFVNWVYQTTQPLLTPFLGIFPNPGLTGGFVVEISALFALIFYTIIGHVVLGIVSDITDRVTARHTHH